jgi:NTE family protein
VSPVTAHARRAYLPEEGRSGIALALSGGGSRAALFELGVLRRLNELGILSRVDAISCVSGGSMLGAHLAVTMDPWPAPGTVYLDFERQVVAPFEAFVKRNLRTAPLARRYLIPWNWFRDTTAIEVLVRLFGTYLTRQQLGALPSSPRFVFNATDNAFGVNWEMSRDRMGSTMAGWMTSPDWSVARAVAASSCLPPLFHPMPIDLPPTELSGGAFPAGDERDGLIRGLRLSDGGLNDNLGLEPIWRDHEIVISVDGAATFHAEADLGLSWPRPSTVAWRIGRYVAILGRQATEMRKRWFISNLTQGVIQGAYVGLGSKVSSYDVAGAGYGTALVDDVISEVRSDLDAFDESEIGVLQNHGYLLADAASRRHLSETIAFQETPVAIPYPDLMDEAIVRTQLAGSRKRRLLGRGRWVDYVFKH